MPKLSEDVLCGLDRSKAIDAHSKELGVSRTSLGRWLGKLNIIKEFHFASGANTAVLRQQRAKEEYSKHPLLCQFCGETLRFKSTSKEYCSHSCAKKSFYLKNPEYRKIQGEEMKKRLEDGTWKKVVPPSNKGKGKPKIDRECPVCKNTFSINFYKSRKYCSPKCLRAAQLRCGGLRDKSGRGKAGWYKGFYCGSSWELAWVIFNIDHSLSFKRNLEGFEYVYEGKTKKYYPDFIQNSRYIEIKGYTTAQWQAKLDQFKHPIEVIGKKEIEPYLEYAVNKYGKDYVNLYDK